MVLRSKCKDVPDPNELLYNTKIEMSSADMHLGVVRSDATATRPPLLKGQSVHDEQATLSWELAYMASMVLVEK